MRRGKCCASSSSIGAVSSRSHSADGSSGTSPNFRISLVSPVAGLPVRLGMTKMNLDETRRSGESRVSGIASDISNVPPVVLAARVDRIF
jgi:hypothetical protein